ncbi:MAG: hypothetical protein K0U84_04905, partial [Actinomycetia bacterium]|nr:hypothetical protein [Actinomycetes bacterium]
MVAGGDTNRVAGLAVSLGIGLGIFIGGLGEAAADTGGTSTDTGDTSTDSARTSTSTDTGGTSTSTDTDDTSDSTDTRDTSMENTDTDGPTELSRGAINDDDIADEPGQTSRQEREAESLTRGEPTEADDLTEDR